MSKNTSGKDYTKRLVDKQFVWWKELLDVQRPYRYNINKLDLGFTLDLGCGIGRNLLHIKGNPNSKIKESALSETAFRGAGSIFVCSFTFLLCQ